MLVSNQQGATTAQQKLNFTPILSKATGTGTAVTYGIQGINSVNASNTYVQSSGNFTNVPVPLNQYSTNYLPTINAGYGTPYSSGYFGVYPTALNQTVLAQPVVDISETTSDVCIAACLPSVALNDVTLSITDNSVTISASAWTGVQNIAYNRTIALPTSIHADSVDASIASGILEIRLPKSGATASRTAVNQSITTNSTTI